MSVREALSSQTTQTQEGRSSSHDAFIWDVFFQVTSSINLESQNLTGIESNRALTPNAGQPGGGNSEAKAWLSRASLGERRPHPRTARQVCLGEQPGAVCIIDAGGGGAVPSEAAHL